MEPGAKGTRESLRSFGKVVGGAFLFFGALLLYLHWNERQTVRFLLGEIFLVVGVLLMVCGFTAPMLLKPLEKAWWAIALVMSAVMTRVFLSIFYYLIIFPIGFVMRLCGRDPMERAYHKNSSTYWTPRKSEPDMDKHCKRQF